MVPICHVSIIIPSCPQKNVSTLTAISFLCTVALELLRDEKSIVSAEATSESFSSVGPAQREYERLSIRSRSKLDRETGTNIQFLYIMSFESSSAAYSLLLFAM